MGRLLAVTALAASGLAFALSAPASAATPAQGVAPSQANPLTGLRFFIDYKWSPAWQDVYRLTAQHELGEAALIRKIAEQPQFKWYGRWAGANSPERTVRKALDAQQATDPTSVPLMVSMRHEGSGCSPTYQGGGARGDAEYRSWIRGFARAIGDRRVVIAYEPDSLGTLECLAKSRRGARLRALRYGVDVLSKLPNATIYLEAGASDWQDAPTMARKLRAIGIAKVRGFMLNATHMDWTAANVRYGNQLSRLVGGKHFIVNTSHNGRGPLHYRKWIDRSRHLWKQVNVWCNPPNSALGPRPTTSTGQPLVDAYLWIERPGYSNGSCHGGPLPVGSWWRQKALTLARRAAW